MEIVGVTRIRDGKEVDEFIVRCEIHNYCYNGRPPLTTGCRECWQAYFFCQMATTDDKKSFVEQLESAIRHAAELQDKGLWDFKPDFHVDIQKEN